MMNNYFNLFNLPEQFELNTETLEQNYRTLAAQFHPDKFAAASSFEQKQAVMMTSTLNEAYRVLSNPLDRAAYLLSHQGIDADSPEHTQFAPEFLMQQMQWRETLMDAKSEHNILQLNELTQIITQEQIQLYEQLYAALDSAELQTAAQLVRQGRFLQKIINEIADIKE